MRNTNRLVDVKLELFNASRYNTSGKCKEGSSVNFPEDNGKSLQYYFPGELSIQDAAK